MKNAMLTNLMGSILAGQSAIRQEARKVTLLSDPWMPRNRQERRAAKKNKARL